MYVHYGIHINTLPLIYILQTGEADIDPVALHQLQQQENLIEMVFLTADQDSEPLAMLSQSDPGSFDDPRNCPMQFVSQLGNTCGMDNFVPPLYKKDKVSTFYM